MYNSTINCTEVLASYPAPRPPVSSAIRDLYCAFILAFSSVTLSGNLAIICVIVRIRALRVRHHAYIVSAAVADIGVALLVMPLRLYEEWNKGWNLPKQACTFAGMCDGVLCSASMGSLYCLAFDRYVSVCRPFSHGRLTGRITGAIIATCWLVPTSIWVIILTARLQVIGIEDMAWCLLQGACPFVLNTAVTLVMGLSVFWMPSLLITFAYWKIYTTARYHVQIIKQTTISDEIEIHKERVVAAKATKSILIVVGCFFFCWLPFFIVEAVHVLTNYSMPVQLRMCVMWLGYLNSMVNPFLYYTFSRQFKGAFKSICRIKIIEPQD